MQLKTEAREIYEWLGEKFNDYGMSSDIWSKLTELYKLAEKNQEPNDDLVKDAMPDCEELVFGTLEVIKGINKRLDELNARVETIKKFESKYIDKHDCDNCLYVDLEMKKEPCKSCVLGHPFQNWKSKN